MSNSTEQSKVHQLFFFTITAPPVFLLDYQQDYWDKKLGEPGHDVLQRFIAEGLIELVPLSRAIERGLTKEQILVHLRARKLRLRGKKSELIERLIGSDPEWARQYSQPHEIYQRTALGNAIENVIAGEIGTESGALEAMLTNLIHDGLYEEAYKAWEVWDAEQFEPYGTQRNLDIAWHAENVDDFVKMAHKISAVLPPGERSRFLAGWLIGRHDLYQCSPLTQQHGQSYRRHLSDAGQAHPDIVGIRIISSPNCRCSFAKKYEGCYRLEDAPPHPFGPCDNEPCCLCWAEYIFNDEQPGDGWCTHQYFADEC